MVKEAETIDKVFPKMLEFIEGSVLVAHNADFDVGFVRAAANKLGIKFNIEMALLVRELRKQMHKKIKIPIGEPIPYTSLDDSKNATQWAQDIREKVYKL